MFLKLSLNLVTNIALEQALGESFKSLAERAQDVYSKKCHTNKTLTEVFEWVLVTGSQDQSVTDAVTGEQELSCRLESTPLGTTVTVVNYSHEKDSHRLQ